MDDLLVQRLKKLEERASFLRGKQHTVSQTVDHLEKEIVRLEEDVSELGKVLKVLGKLADNMAKKDLNVINNLVNYGLRVVFPDRNLTFKASMVEVGGKMQINFETFDDGKLADSDTHGSVSTIESLLLRLICLTKVKAGKLLLLDETFAALDDDYIIRVGILLRELAEKMKMDILLATFNASASEAHTVIRAKHDKKSNELTVTSHSLTKDRVQP